MQKLAKDFGKGAICPDHGTIFYTTSNSQLSGSKALTQISA
jgi:hypothetical protein